MKGDYVDIALRGNCPAKLVNSSRKWEENPEMENVVKKGKVWFFLGETKLIYLYW